MRRVAYRLFSKRLRWPRHPGHEGARFRPSASMGVAAANGHVAPGYKNKIRYTLYISTESQILHIATNKSNINKQYSIYNVLSINNITLDRKQ